MPRGKAEKKSMSVDSPQVLCLCQLVHEEPRLRLDSSDEVPLVSLLAPLHINDKGVTQS